MWRRSFQQDKFAKLAPDDVLLENAGHAGLTTFLGWLQTFVMDAYQRHEQPWVPEGDPMSDVPISLASAFKCAVVRCANFFTAIACMQYLGARSGLLLDPTI
jgi:hypothetical protein